MNQGKRLTIVQTIGGLIICGTAMWPALALWQSHGTIWGLLLWMFIAAIGGTVGGLLLASRHRIAGAAGGLLGGPMILVALYAYLHGRTEAYKLEVVFVFMIACLPGLGVYFVLRLLTDLLFPARRVEADEYADELELDEEEDRPRRQRRDWDEDDDERPRPSRDHVTEDEDRPRRRRRNDDDEDDVYRRKRRPARDDDD